MHRAAADRIDENGRTAPLRVLQTFPHKLGSGRIADTAWYQAEGVGAAGADLLVFPAAVSRPLPSAIRVRPTLARGRWRIPYKAIGHHHAFALHDRIVARRLEDMVHPVDIVHAWPMGALETLRAAKRLGVPTVLERPNAHTRFAYEVVQQECERLGIVLPRDHEHAYNEAVLRKEEQEYELADRLLCPSEFTRKTFLDRGFPSENLARHVYGYDETRYFPDPLRKPPPPQCGLTVLYAGVAAVRKGLHFALQAWLDSSASERGTFLIAGGFLPAYAAKLADALSHPSVRVLGHRDDVPDLMRRSDVFVLPSIEEGFGLVCVEALASGAVPLVSDACTEVCVHNENALVHRAGDVDALKEQFTMLHEDRDLLAGLRAGALRTAPDYTWRRAGVRLLGVYRDVVGEAAAAHVVAGVGA